MNYQELIDYNNLSSLDEPRIQRAQLSLQGLSIGDAFGDKFFIDADKLSEIFLARILPAPPWPFTDDTMMAMSIYDVLRRYGVIIQDWLAASFAEHYDISRGYGPSMHGQLQRLQAGERWQDIAYQLFDGQGSYGNGAAMRVAPIGAYFADDLNKVIKHATLSAEVTHANNEAIAGAIAIAVATAIATRLKDIEPLPNSSEFLDLILPTIPESTVRTKVRKARDMDTNASVPFAVAVLGNGLEVSAQDTVPFALWCASHYLNNYQDALWVTASGEGDRDTTCAMVGGIVIMSADKNSLPQEWLMAREPLPNWPFGNEGSI